MTAQMPRNTTQPGLPPGPRFAALQTALYMRDAYGYTRRLRERYGDTVTMPSMNGQIVLTMTPAGAREILDQPIDHYGESFASSALAPILGEASLFPISGKRHRTERKLLSPTFHGNRMRSLAPAMLKATLERSHRWREGDHLVLLDEMQAISLEVIIGAVLGVTDPERRELFRAAVLNTMNDAINPALIFFTSLQRPFGGIGPWSRFLHNRDLFRRLIAEEIAVARQSPAGERPDILARLAHATREDGDPFPDETIRDHLVTLLIAGHETTASALAWTFSELSRNPDVCSWLLEQVATTGSEPTPESLAGLPALEATSREGLRLHPIIAEFFRTVREPTSFQGFEIPVGSVLAASILEIHQDASLYPEPETFRPSRFLERKFAPHEFSAFGGGHRHCLGSAFALAEMAVVIGTLLPRFHFESASSEPPAVGRRNVTLPPKGGAPVRVRFR